MLKIPKFIELASNWTKRLPVEMSTEMSTAKEVEVRNKKKEKDIKKKDIYMSEKFILFWKLYPNKVSKKEANIRWNKIKPSDKLSEKIMAALREQINWRNNCPRDVFMPSWKNPATWINKECWNDECDYEYGKGMY